MEFARNTDETDVPDPYYGGGRGFETVLDLVEDASEGLLLHLKKNKLV
jgi:protein-tyrosine phosphatase